MNGRSVAGAVLALAVGVAVYALWPKEKLSPEDEVRQLIGQMVAAGEKRDPQGVVEGLHDAFRGPSGSDKQQVKQLLLGQFFRAQQVVVMNPLLDVTASSPTTVHFKGTFVFARDGASPDASRYEIEGDAEKADGEWKIVSASWNR